MAVTLLRRNATDLMHPGGVDSLARIEVGPMPDDRTAPENTARHLSRRPGQMVECGWCGRPVEVPARGRVPLCALRRVATEPGSRAGPIVTSRPKFASSLAPLRWRGWWLVRSGSRFPRNLAAPRSGRPSLRCSRLDLPRGGSTVATCPRSSPPSAASLTSGYEPSTRVTEPPTNSTSPASRPLKSTTPNGRLGTFSWPRTWLHPHRTTPNCHISSGTHLWHPCGRHIVGTIARTRPRRLSCGLRREREWGLLHPADGPATNGTVERQGA